jgi:hypothetical protein
VQRGAQGLSEPKSPKANPRQVESARAERWANPQTASITEVAGVLVNERIERTTILAVYSAIVAACYLAAFWSRFDINIFQFAGLTGFASLALYPLMTAFGLNVFTMFFLPRFPRKAVAPTGSGSKKSFLWALGKAIYMLWVVLGPAAALAAYMLMTSPYKWPVILMAIIPFINGLAEHPIMEGIVRDEQRRREITYWVVAFPILAAMFGGLNAQTILDGAETRIVVPAGGAKNLQADADHPIAFLGFSGGTYFLYESKSGNVVMVNQAVAEPLTFQPRPQKLQPADFPKWLKGFFHR